MTTTSISRLTAATALGLVAALLFADLAAASKRTVTRFQGSRDQVRSACANVGGELIEGSNFTMCNNLSNDTTVECDDRGSCVGGSRPTQRFGFGSVVVGGGTYYSTTPSLSETGTGPAAGAAPPASDPPAPTPEPDQDDPPSDPPIIN